MARPAAVCGLFALVLLAAACGGSSSTTAATTTTTPTTTAGGNGAARLAAFRACMQSHGVTVPANARLGGGGGRFGAGGTGSTTDTTGPAPTTTIPPGVTEQQWQTAVTACASTLPNRQNNPQVQIYVNCLNSYLSSHGGTTIPTGPGAAGVFGGRAGASGETTTTNPTLQAAMAHCAALRPAFGGRGSTTTSIG